MEALRLVFIGPPGTGKGTQASRLVERFGFVTLSSGDLLRAELAAGSDLGRQAEGFMKAGELVPDDILTGVILARVEKIPPENGLILDGFPRTLPQAEALDRGLAEAGRPIDGALDFQMDDELIVRRITSRRSCNNCSAVYNVAFLPPRVADVCDKCSEGLVQRADDREEVVATRLEAYRAQTAPLVGYYRDRGLLHTLDASGSVDEVTAATVCVVESLGRSR